MSLMGQQEYVIAKDHHRANDCGQVYVHVLEAEKMLGRRLLYNEVVHHRDSNKLNNLHSNLLVFSSNGDHARFHMYDCDESLLVSNSNGSFSCPKKNLDLFICPTCGKQKDKKASMCIDCRKHQMRSKIPPIHLLKDKIEELGGNFSAIGRFYGVTDNSVRKWCKKYNLKYHSKDYRSIDVP